MIIAGLCAFGVLLLARPRSPTRSAGGLVWPAAFAAIGIVLTLLLDARMPAGLVLLMIAMAVAVVRTVGARRARTARDMRAAAVLATCEGLAADLNAGLSSESALASAADSWQEFRPVVHAAQLGADVPGALRELATLPGAEPLNQVAAAWTVAHRSGAGLATSMSLAAQAIREDRALRRTVSAELSAALATARLLAVLPLPVLLIGRGAGGDPFAFLFATSPGLVCLATGLGLGGLGMIWLERIVDGTQTR